MVSKLKVTNAIPALLDAIAEHRMLELRAWEEMKAAERAGVTREAARLRTRYKNSRLLRQNAETALCDNVRTLWDAGLIPDDLTRSVAKGGSDPYRYVPCPRCGSTFRADLLEDHEAYHGNDHA